MKPLANKKKAFSASFLKKKWADIAPMASSYHRRANKNYDDDCSHDESDGSHKCSKDEESSLDEFLDSKDKKNQEM